MNDPREELIMKLGLSPVLAHQTLFKHRHEKQTQPFHKQIIIDWHSDAPRVLNLLFRGAGKSTIAEEAICTLALFRRFNNGVIIGETETRAVERLAAIKHEFETNEDIQAIFGDVVGPKWQETKIELSSGVMLQAYGRGQSLRGVKHYQYRPDMAFLDDLEDEESVRSADTRDKTINWLTKTLMPALTPTARVRMAATPLHPEALALKLANLKDDRWLVRRIPIKYRDEAGVWTSSWPDQYTLPFIDAVEEDYRALGKHESFVQEYMMEATDPADKAFKPEHIKCLPLIRAYQPTFAIYDPARTTKATSAFTGKVVVSWTNKLIIWESDAQLWKPDEIIDDIFKVNARYDPIAIGVETNGLEEFIEQPLRHEQVKRSELVPLRALRAPRDKKNFIRGLVQLFKAGDVEFAGDRDNHARLIEQLLAFPSGRIDAPNALAYVYELRPGQPIYEEFAAKHVVNPPAVRTRFPLYLALNASHMTTTALLLQVYEGFLVVLADFVAEGDPGIALPGLVQQVAVAARAPFKVVIPARHYEVYDTVGLKGALKNLRLEPSRGGDVVQGREELRQMLRRQSHNREAVQVSAGASWALRALSGGYARAFGEETPAPGPYRTLMEGLEAFAATLRASSLDIDEELHYEYTSDGRKYISALAQKRS